MAREPVVVPEITILMPTYKRAVDFRRTLHYMAETFDLSKQPFIVLDGSPEPIASLNHKTCNELAVRYESYDPDFPQFERWLDGIRKADTPFVCFVPDDDFIGPTALKKCVRFLLDNSDYAAACGKVLTTLIEPGKSQLLYFMYPWLESITSENPLERVVQFYYNYSDMTYAVHRKELLEMVMKEIVEHVNPNYFVFMEYFENALLPLYGKIKQVPELYMCRKRDPVQPPLKKGEYRPPNNATHEKLNSDRMLYTHGFIDQLNRLKAVMIRHAYVVGMLQPGIAELREVEYDFEGYLERQIPEILEHCFSAYMARVFFVPTRQYFLGIRKSRRPWPKFEPYPTKAPLAIVGEIIQDLVSWTNQRWLYWQQATTDKYFNIRPLMHQWLCREPDARAIATFIERWEDDLDLVAAASATHPQSATTAVIVDLNKELVSKS